MKIHSALVGNPNCGKTTLFNALTGSAQYVGNWPGVTVEKKEGKYLSNKEVVLTDLPGVYSLSPYSPEEIVTRDYLMGDEPDVVINIVDTTNLERNLYLTTQILELGIPVVVALNMMDLVKKRGDTIDVSKLSQKLGCPIVEISALKGTGMEELMETALATARAKVPSSPLQFSEPLEKALARIARMIKGRVPDRLVRWYTLKLFEGEEKSMQALNLSPEEEKDLALIRQQIEEEREDDADSIITSERYDALTTIVAATVKHSSKGMSTTQKIDRVLTNRWLGLPIFMVIMTLVYFIAVSTVGTIATDWVNEGLFGEGWFYPGGAASAIEQVESGAGEYGLFMPGIPVVLGDWLTSLGTAEWLQSLLLDGVVSGVGAVLGFVPQMIVLFLMLSFLEGCGYMARVAFIMDRIFRKFGLSGKSFIPMLIASGCGVPAIMATKTIENEKDRRMTIATATMIPCSAKMPLIALVFGAIAGGNAGETWWVAPLFYFLGVFAIIVSGIILKKTRMFAGEASPFIMELPQYHLPAAKNVLLQTWERVRSFVVRAGTIIFLSAIVVWFLLNFGFSDASFGMLDSGNEDYLSYSLMAFLGKGIAWIFAPLGFGNWDAVVATLTGLVAKENVVSTLNIIFSLGDAGEADASMWEAFAQMFASSTPALMAFCAFNLLCAPCFAAIGAIRRQMASAKWTGFALGYMTVFAWCVALIVYQFGGFITGELDFTVWTGVAIVILLAGVFQLVRPLPHYERGIMKSKGHKEAA